MVRQDDRRKGDPASALDEQSLEALLLDEGLLDERLLDEGLLDEGLLDDRLLDERLLDELQLDALPLDERLAQLRSMGPPAALDELVQKRCKVELAIQRDRIASEAEAPLGPSVPVPLAERCVYVVGLALYGTAALNVFARAVWRVFSG